MNGFDAPVRLAQVGDVDWVLTRALRYVALDGTVVEVPAGAGTDGASVPRVTAWLAPRSGRYLPAAVMHDWAYRVLVRDGRLTHRRADALLLEAMARLGVPLLLRLAMWAAVRWSALLRGRRARRDLLGDLPGVLATTVPALIVVVPVSVVVGGGLLMWWLLEVVARLLDDPDAPTTAPSAEILRSRT